MTEATPLASEQITQEDREAAAGMIDTYEGKRRYADIVRAGMRDAHPMVRAFARHRIAALSASPAPSGQGVSGEGPTDAQVREAMQEAWDNFCDDAQAIPGDIRREGRKTFFVASTWADHTAMNLRAIMERDAAPAPSCAPGEVERLISDVTAKADQCDRLAEVSRSPACFEYRAKAQAYREVITLLGALSPQGLDAKEVCGKPVAWVSPGQLAAHNPGPDDNRYLPVVKEPGGNFIMPLYATPSQRLDAATVERWVPQIGQRVRVTDASEFAGVWARTDLWVSGISVHGSGDGLDVAVAEEWPVYPRGRHHNGQTDGWRVGATSCRDQLEPLATEPHQHGGKGA